MPWLQIIIIFFLSSIKMLLALPMALGLFKLDSHTTFITASLGSIFGCILFVFLSSRIWKWLNIYISQKFTKKESYRIFTPNKRRYIFYKNKFGFIGLIILTPTILSIPLGCFLALKFFKKRAKVLIWMCVACVTWAWLVSYLYDYFK